MKRKVQYYETDMMGIVHHANYLHWMEEARIELLEQMGFPYADMEAAGIVSPVRAVHCEYKRPCTFGDTLEIDARIRDFNGVVLTVGYDMRKPDGELVCTARSEHVFLNREGGFIRMKRDMPEFCRAVEAMVAEEATR